MNRNTAGTGTPGTPLSQRALLARVITGAAVGVALWCILFSLQLVDGFVADTWGVLLFTLGGAALGATRLRQALTALLVAGAALVVLVTLTPVSTYLARRWVRADRLPAGPLPAVVALSAGVNPDNTMTTAALDNLLTALTVIREGKAATLVTSTVERQFPTGLVSSRTDQARVITLFGAQVKWTPTRVTRSTHDEAVESARILLPSGIRDIAIVAAPMHTRRACSTFEAAGFRVTCVPALARSPGGGNPAPWPSDRLTVFGEWIYEALAVAKYKAAGWVRK